MTACWPLRTGIITVRPKSYCVGLHQHMGVLLWKSGYHWPYVGMPEQVLDVGTYAAIALCRPAYDSLSEGNRS